MVGTGPGFMGLSSEVGTGDGVSTVQPGFGTTVTNQNGVATVGMTVPIVEALPTANLPTQTGQGLLVYLTTGTPGLYLYDPLTATWGAV